MSQPATVLWVGTYPAAGQGTPTGQGEGVWRVELDAESGRLLSARQVAGVPAPSFLAFGAEIGTLLAVNETAEGGLTTFRLTDGEVEITARTPTGGAHPCHLWFDKTLRAVIVANYTAGSLAVIKPGPDGQQGLGQVIQLEGSGPNRARQTSPHPHFILPAPGERYILAVDLGSDVTWRFRRDHQSRTLVEDGIAVRLPAGCGPRHAAFSNDGRLLYVVGELDARLYTIAWDRVAAAGRTISATTACPDVKAGVELAHVTLTGDQILMGARGPDLLVSQDAASVSSTRGGSCYRLPGSVPRHHTVVGGWVVVALQGSSQLCVLDRNNGTLVDTTALPSPACILSSRT